MSGEPGPVAQRFDALKFVWGKDDAMNAVARLQCAGLESLVSFAAIRLARKNADSMGSSPTIFATNWIVITAEQVFLRGGMVPAELSGEEFSEDGTRDREMFRGEAQSLAFPIEEALPVERLDLALDCGEAGVGAVRVKRGVIAFDAGQVNAIELA